MTVRTDMKSLFKKSFGRDPSDRELGGLIYGRLSKNLFKEWLERELKQSLTKEQLATFLQRYRAKNGADLTMYDIFLLQTRSLDNEVVEQVNKVLEVARDSKRFIAQTTSGSHTTPTVEGIRISAGNQGERRRHAEDTAMRKIEIDEAVKYIQENRPQVKKRKPRSKSKRTRPAR